MAEATKPELTYVCPQCGQTALIGSHFCKTTGEPGREPLPERPRRTPGGNRNLFLLVMTVTAVFVLWRWLGPAALMAVALAWLMLLLFGRKKKG